GYSQESFGASGAVVAHAGGVTFGQPTGDTVAIVHAPGAAGAHVLNAPGVMIDHFGYALVPYLTPYQLDATSAQVAPFQGAVVWVDFKSKAGRALIARIDMADGKPAPFGAQVFNAKDDPLGVVGQAGLTLLRGVSDSGTLSVNWRNTQGTAQSCAFAYVVP